MINGKDVSMRKIPFSQSVILTREEQLALAREIANSRVERYVVKEQRNEALASLERVSVLSDHITAALDFAVEAMIESDEDFSGELERIRDTLVCGHQDAYPGESVPGE